MILEIILYDMDMATHTHTHLVTLTKKRLEAGWWIEIDTSISTCNN